MQEARYMISDAAKKLDVEPHVLRYWEEELELDIPRNEMGHRFYREKEMDNFFAIRRLKEQGFHLRAIKALIPDLSRIAALDKEQLQELRYELENQSTLFALSHSEPNIAPINPTTPPIDDKMEQFKHILGRIVSEAIQHREDHLEHNITDTISKEMDYMFRQKEEADEARYRTLDETIRNFQKARQEAAAAEATDTKKAKKGHKKGFFKAKK